MRTLLGLGEKERPGDRAGSDSLVVLGTWHLWPLGRLPPISGHCTKLGVKARPLHSWSS